MITAQARGMEYLGMEWNGSQVHFSLVLEYCLDRLQHHNANLSWLSRIKRPYVRIIPSIENIPANHGYPERRRLKQSNSTAFWEIVGQHVTPKL